MTYCEYVDVAEYINTDGDRGLIEACITRAQAQIDRHTKRTFEATADSTRYFHAINDVDLSDLIFDHDLCAITSITNGDGTTVTTGQYDKLPANRTPWYAVRLKSSAAISWTYTTDPENAIAVVGRWAYDTSVPADIKDACVRLATHKYRLRDHSDSRDATTYTTSGTILQSNRLPREVEELLEPFIRRLA